MMKKIKEIKKMTRSQAGKLGAAALNSDPVKKSLSAKKAAATRKKLNPKIYTEMGAKGGRRTAQNSKLKISTEGDIK